MLTIINDKYKKDNSTKWYVDVKCDCGTIDTKMLYHYNNRKHDCCKACITTTHNMSRTRQYRIWSGMVERTTNENNPAYVKYGGRGIDIPEEWKVFTNFWKDMSVGYSDELSIDRKDNNKGYSKDNCRWVTNGTQQRNKRVTSSTGFRNITKNYKGFKAAIQVDGKVHHIGTFDTAENASIMRDIYVIQNNIDAPTRLKRITI